MVIIIAYIAYVFTKPNYNVGDAFNYYQKYGIGKNGGKIFDYDTNSVYIETKDNFKIFIQQCINIDWNKMNNIKQIHPILFVNGGPGMPPQKCPLFLSLLTNKLNANDNNEYYIPYIYHQRGTGKSSRLYSGNVSFTDWNEKSAAFEQLHQNLGFHQHLLDIERIRQYLYTFYERKLSHDVNLDMKSAQLSLIGHSFGCIFSSLYAAEFPQNVDRLILIAGAPLLDFNVFFPKYDIFKMIGEYLPESMQQEFSAWSGKYVNFYDTMEMNETEINKLNLGFLKYYKMAQRKHINKLKFPDDDYGSNICDKQKDDKMDLDSFVKNIGGWMITAIYYDMGMWHFWTNKVKERICDTSNQIKGLVLHCEYDLQEFDASMEYLKIVECNTKYKDLAMKNVIPKADHMIVYHDKAECLLELVDKIYKRCQD